MNRRFLTLEQLKSVASALLAKINQKPDSSSLSDVSFTGDYNDLSNRPDFSNFVNQIALQDTVNDINSNYMMIGRDYVTAGQKTGTILGNLVTAEGNQTTANRDYSHAEGDNTIASGDQSHAEGFKTTASGTSSHAEGHMTTASGPASHAEGKSSTASGYYSHAEGSGIALGDYSHAEGSATTAQRKSQHVFGEYNVLDTTGTTTTRGQYVEIVGNGNAANTTRSNARTLDWSGNEWLAGKLTVGADPTNNMDVATKQYVDNKTDNDNKVAQSSSTTANWRKLLLHYKDDTASTTAVTSSTNQVYAAVGISAQPSTGTIRANAYNVADKVTMQYNATTHSLDILVS